MSVISIRLPEKLLHELDSRAHALRITRAAYIRKAIEYMNEESMNLECKKRMARASLRVRKESMRMNKEFSEIENDPEN
jgi:metal-responsive CopG/Arc/MetJ family transcriptional regulator